MSVDEGHGGCESTLRLSGKMCLVLLKASDPPSLCRDSDERFVHLLSVRSFIPDYNVEEAQRLV